MNRERVVGRLPQKGARSYHPQMKAPWPVFFTMAWLLAGCSETTPTRESFSSSPASAAPQPAMSVPKAPPSASSSAPPPEAPPIPSLSASVSAAPPAESSAYCMSAADSMDRAKPHQPAKPPFANCAVGVFSHCGGGNGERGHLCSKPLDEQATLKARKTKANECCYRMGD